MKFRIAVQEKLRADVEHHVGEEETEAFPKFRDAVRHDLIESLGQQVEDMKASSQ